MFTEFSYFKCFIFLDVMCGGILAQNYDPTLNLSNYLDSISYNVAIPPKINPLEIYYGSGVPVTYTLIMTQLVSLDSAEQKMVISCYIDLNWIDERLVWDPDYFASLTTVFREASKVWHPRIMLYNGLGTKQELDPPSRVQLLHLSTSTTSVSSTIKKEISVGCTFDVSKFPNDVQTCEIHFYGAELFNKPKLAFKSEDGTIEALYEANNEWILLNSSNYILEKEVKLTKSGKPSVNIQLYVVQLKFKRVSTYYVMNIIIPMILLAFLQILVFFVPIESGEKMGLGITVLLSFTVFLLLLDSIIPKSVKLPIVSTFITASMIVSAVSLLITSWVLRLYYTPAEVQMSRFMFVVFVKGIGGLMCFYPSCCYAPKVAPQNTVDKEIVYSNREKHEDDNDNKDVKDDHCISNPWQIAALAIERLMFFVGILIFLSMSGALIIPTFV